MTDEIDPLARKAQADLIVDRAAEQLRRIVKDMTARLDPFPAFPGAFFTYGIEIEPEAAARTDRGCVVLGQDGEFHELLIGVDFEGMDLGGTDPVSMRKEELTKLTLHPRDYIVYAHNAISVLAELLLDQEERAAGGQG
jgi:hypothetical protein